MNRALTLDDAVVAGIAVAAGLVAAFLSRSLLRWLAKHAKRTRWSGDDIIVDALRSIVPWALIAAGVAARRSCCRSPSPCSTTPIRCWRCG